MGRSRKGSRATLSQAAIGGAATSTTAVNSPPSQDSTAFPALDGSQQVVPAPAMHRSAGITTAWGKGGGSGSGSSDADSIPDRDWPTLGVGKLYIGGSSEREPGGNTQARPGNGPAPSVKADGWTSAPWEGSDSVLSSASCVVPPGASNSGVGGSRPSSSMSGGRAGGPNGGPWNSGALQGSRGCEKMGAGRNGGGSGNREYCPGKYTEESWSSGHNMAEESWPTARPRAGVAASFAPGSVWRSSTADGRKPSRCAPDDNDDEEDGDNEDASDVDSDESGECRFTESELRGYEKKFYGGFMEGLRRMDTDELDSSSCEGCCPVCKTVDHFVKLSSFEQHAKTKSSRRRPHLAFAMEIAKLREERAKTAARSASARRAVWRSLENSADVQIVWPPWVIVQNTRKNKDATGKWVGMGSSELRPLFGKYTIVKEKHSYGPEGHRGMSALEFESTPAGYLGAMDLHDSFQKEGRGRKEWESARKVLIGSESSDGFKKNLFGYLATEKDVVDFNRHCAGKKNQRAIKYSMVSRQEMVVEPQKIKDAESRKIDELKSRAMIAQEHVTNLERQKRDAEQRYSKVMDELQFQREVVQKVEEQHRSEREARRRFYEQKLKQGQEEQERLVLELQKRRQIALRRDEDEIHNLIQSQNLTEEDSSRHRDVLWRKKSVQQQMQAGVEFNEELKQLLMEVNAREEQLEEELFGARERYQKERQALIEKYLRRLKEAEELEDDMRQKEMSEGGTLKGLNENVLHNEMDEEEIGASVRGRGAVEAGHQTHKYEQFQEPCRSPVGGRCLVGGELPVQRGFLGGTAGARLGDEEQLLAERWGLSSSMARESVRSPAEGSRKDGCIKTSGCASNDMADKSKPTPKWYQWGDEGSDVAEEGISGVEDDPGEDGWVVATAKGKAKGRRG